MFLASYLVSRILKFKIFHFLDFEFSILDFELSVVLDFEFSVEPPDFCSKIFFGGIGTVFVTSNLLILLITTLLILFPYFRLLSIHLLQVIMAEVVKLITIIAINVRKSIPEVFVKVTQIE